VQRTDCNRHQRCAAKDVDGRRDVEERHGAAAAAIMIVRRVTGFMFGMTGSGISIKSYRYFGFRLRIKTLEMIHRMSGRNAHERDGAHNRHEPAKDRPAAESCKGVKHLDLPVGLVFSGFCLRGAL